MIINPHRTMNSRRNQAAKEKRKRPQKNRVYITRASTKEKGHTFMLQMDEILKLNRKWVDMIDISKFYRNKLTQGKCPESHRKRPRSHNKIKPATIK